MSEHEVMGQALADMEGTDLDVDTSELEDHELGYMVDEATLSDLWDKMMGDLKVVESLLYNGGR